MRVLFSPDMFVMQRFGGITRYFAEIHSELVKAGIDARIFAGLHGNEYVNRRSATWELRLPWHQRLRLSRAAFRAYVAAQRGPYIVHPTYYTTRMLPGSRPHVCTFHDLIHFKYPTYFSPSDNTVERQLYWARHADRIIAVSHSTAEDLVALFRVPRHKIAVVHHGVRIPTTMKRDVGDYLLYVGTRNGWKNWPIVLKALLARECATLRLVCAGGGAPTPQEMTLLADLGLSRRVEFVQAGEKELDGLYRNALALVYPSLYEGFGLPLLEAMARGVPVVASRTSSIPEVAGDAALLFSPREVDELVHAIEGLFDDSTRRELEKRGRERAGKFSWTRTARQTIEVYRDLLPDGLPSVLRESGPTGVDR
ncbi:glycosyltransferase family 1 protein [Streptomyces sp. NPDC002896]|uniref:glycosyltransferase family 4 protein n=1 Tax=Streptomyces sp. NPDC002896 TaxID=3154438 RepID=UPI00331D1209